MVHLIIVAGAAGFGFLTEIIAALAGQGGGLRGHLRSAALRASAYVTVVAMLEILARYQPPVAQMASDATWTLVVTEIAAGVAALVQAGLLGKNAATGISTVAHMLGNSVDLPASAPAAASTSKQASGSGG